MPITPPGSIGDWTSTYLTKFLNDWLRRNPLPAQDQLTIKKLSATDSLTAPTRPNADNSTNVATTAFVEAAVAAGGTPAPTRQTFESGSGTYNTPAGVKAILVECIGGGGGGGGAVVGTSGQVAVGGGGGGGAYSASLIENPSTSYAYAIGGGGTVGGNPGGTGGDTTFGSTLVVAKGGAGGVGMTASGAAPQAANGGLGGSAASGTGDIKASGGAGGMGLALAASGSSTGGGPGGAAPVYGAPGRMQASNASNGLAGQQYGGGGSGGVRTASTATQTGGAGATGLIVVTEFY